VHGVGARRIVWAAFGQADAAAGQEGAGAIEARPAGNGMLVVVSIERDELAVVAFGPIEEEGVERFRPCGP
jgi:hypothetical protein